MATSEAQKKASVKYMKENLERVDFRIPKGKKEALRAHAASKGLALTAYIKRLIEQDSGIEL